MTIHYQFVAKSGNETTGPIPIVTAGRQSCPPSCPLYDNGCYADLGPISLKWRAITEGRKGDPWEYFLPFIRTIRRGRLWRWGDAGDLPGEGEEIDAEKLAELVEANKDRRGFAYTHKPVMTHPANLAAVRAANEGGFTVNLSADDLEEADALAETGLPVVVLLPHNHVGTTKTPAGRTVCVCPAKVEGSAITCFDCGLCQIQKRNIVGFPAHGTKWKLVDVIAKGGKR